MSKLASTSLDLPKDMPKETGQMMSLIMTAITNFESPQSAASAFIAVSQLLMTISGKSPDEIFEGSLAFSKTFKDSLGAIVKTLKGRNDEMHDAVANLPRDEKGGIKWMS